MQLLPILDTINIRKKIIYEVLEDKEILHFTKMVMLQAATILQTNYTNDFSLFELDEHIDDLLKRFQNKTLKDTVYRVGQDRLRKLGPNDRFVGVIRMAERLGKNMDMIVKAMVYVFFFKATDEDGNRSTNDQLFDNYLSKEFGFTLQEVSKFNPNEDKELIENFVSHNNYLRI
jgi:mannitol-1-phosphate 5-dehydrogenase